jgi:hypothetical protein
MIGKSNFSLFQSPKRRSSLSLPKIQFHHHTQRDAAAGIMGFSFDSWLRTRKREKATNVENLILIHLALGTPRGNSARVFRSPNLISPTRSGNQRALAWHTFGSCASKFGNRCHAPPGPGGCASARPADPNIPPRARVAMATGAQPPSCATCWFWAESNLAIRAAAAWARTHRKGRKERKSYVRCATTRLDYGGREKFNEKSMPPSFCLIA